MSSAKKHRLKWQKEVSKLVVRQLGVDMYVFESSGVAYIDVFHSSKHHLAFSLNWHRSVVGQGSSSSEHFNLCCTVSSSAPHWQVVFVAGSTKPHFFS